MRWWFALLGLIFGRLWGAVAGYLIGWAIEQWLGIRPAKRDGLPAVEAMQDLVTLAVALARADGELDRREVRAIRRFFELRLGFRGRRLDWLREAIKAEAHDPAPLTPAVRRLASVMGPLERQLILHVLAGVALADGRLDPAELDLLQQFAASWEIPVPPLDPAAAGPGGSWGSQRGRGAGPRPDPAAFDRRRAWARSVLGVDTAASREDLDRAYRQKAREHHPDRFSHLGEELSRAAHERFVELQEAYRLLTSDRA